MLSNSQAKFFFLNHAYLNAYIQLFNGIRRDGGLFLLTGQAGIGKTCLLRKLEREIPENIKFVFCYSTNLDFENLIAVICDKLGIETTDNQLANKILALKEFIIGSAHQGIKVTFLIDDAHSLGQDVLRDFIQLLDLKLPDGHTPRIVLSGTPMLEEVLERLGVTPHVAAKNSRVRLEPLTVSDVATYMSRTINNINSSNVGSGFSPLAIQQITRYTGGIPRLINVLCERALFIARLGQEDSASIAAIDEAASELMLQEKGNIADLITTNALDNIDLQNETQFNDESWQNSSLEPVINVERLDDKTADILNDRFLNEEPEADLDQTVNESVFQNLSGCPVTAVSFSNKANQLARLEGSAVRPEHNSIEVTRSDLGQSASEDEYPVNAITTAPWDYLRYRKNPERFFRSKNFQLVFFVIIAILAGLLGGVGGVYLFHLSAEPVSATLPDGVSQSSHGQASASAQPISVPEPNGDRPVKSESNQAAILGSSANSARLSSSPSAERFKADKAVSVFWAEPVTPFPAISLSPLIEPRLPAGYALALQRDPAISASMPPSLAVGPRSSTELTASVVTSVPRVDSEVAAVSEPTTETVAPVATPVVENEKTPAAKSVSTENSIEAEPEASRVSSYMTSGDAYMERGDIASARLFYLEAVKSRFPAAMFAVGKTYDPIELKRLGIKGFPAEPDKAAEWYMKAEKAGYAEASEFLVRLKQ